MAMPPPFKMKTRGRDNIKAPQKYEGLITHSSPDEPIYRPTAGPKKSSAYRGKVVEFNPDLPPATFPTLEFGQRRGSNAPVVRDTLILDSLTEPTNKKLPCEMHRPACSLPSTSTFRRRTVPAASFENSAFHNAGVDTDPQRLRHSHMTRNEMGISALPRSTMINPQSTCSMEKGDSSQGEIRWETRNDLQNPVYAKNVKIMKRLDARTQMDWNIAEMETSDEGEPSAGRVTSNGTRSHRSSESLRRLWEELPVALKIDLVHIMAECYTTRSEAIQRLRLNGAQTQGLLDLLGNCDAQKSAEDEAAATLRSETMGILLSRGDEELKRVTQTRFRQMLEDGLYKSKGEDYHTITSAELSKAKEYLRCCSQKPDLLDHWTSALNSAPGGRTDANLQDSSIRRIVSGKKVIPEAVSTTRSGQQKVLSTIKPNISAQPASQGAMLKNSPSLGSTPRNVQPPPHLPILMTSLKPPIPILSQRDVPNLPKASDMHTPLLTPNVLVQEPASDYPSNAKTLDKQPANVDRENDEEPPSKKRQVSNDQRKSAPPASISTPPTNKDNTREVSHPTTTSANAPTNGAAPKAIMVATKKINSMTAPPHPVLRNATNDTTPRQVSPPTTSPLPPPQASDRSRRKSVASKPALGSISDERANKALASKVSRKAPPKIATSPPASGFKKAGATTRKKNAALADSSISKGTGKSERRFAPGTVATRASARRGGVDGEGKDTGKDKDKGKGGGGNKDRGVVR